MVLEVTLEREHLYLAERLAKLRYEGDITRAFYECLLRLVTVFNKARESGLWYRGLDLGPSSIEDPGTGPEDYTFRGEDQDNWGEPKFEISGYGSEDDDDAEESPGIPIFPIRTDHGVEWNRIVRDTAEAVLPDRVCYTGPGQKRKFRLIASAGNVVQDFASRYFGYDSGNPVDDLARTSVTVSTGLKELESRGKFVFQKIKSGKIEPVTFFAEE